MHKTSTLIILLFLASTMLAQTPVMVMDINPGIPNGFPDNKEHLVSIGDIIYFAANDGSNGAELWRSDGTEPGTYMVKDIQPGELGSAPVRFSVLGNHVLFFANDGIHGDELWSTDGTEAGTQLVRDINVGTGHSIRRNYTFQVRDRMVLNGVMYFAADNGTAFSQLWRSDGTEQGTVFVKTVCNVCSATISNTSFFTALNDTLYLVGGGSTLWRSDGTTTGTTIVVQSSDQDGPGLVRHLLATNGVLNMSGGHDISSLDFWVSDGTKAGTRMVKDMIDYAVPHGFTALGERVFFISDDNVWSSDGTEAGTIMESSLVAQNVFSRKNNLYLWNNEIYYRAIAGDSQSNMYKTDGINGETEVFTQNFQGTAFGDPIFFASTDEFLYYDAVNENPIAAGIARINKSGTIKEIIPVGSLVEFLFIAGNNLFFRASISGHGEELWKLSLSTSPTTTPNQLALRLYPTISTDGVFYLDYAGQPASHFNISVYDALGRCVYRAEQSSDAPIQLSVLPAGNYFVRIAAENGQFTVQKIILR